MKRLLSIIVPCYNEAETVGRVLEKILATDYGMRFEAIVVDDGSTDSSREKIESISKGDSRVRLVSFPGNSGKGFAIAQGIKSARGGIVAIQDADLEYKPAQIPLLIGPILAGKADAVFGSRFRGEIRGMSLAHRLGNRALTLATNALFGSRLTDTETCHKAIAASLAKGLGLKRKGFETENEITAKLLKAGARIEEVPISYSARPRSQGKKIKWSDGITALLFLLKCRFFE